MRASSLRMWSSANAGPQSQSRSLGMTAPISNAGPEEKDLELTSQLQETLIPHGCFESEEELNHRMDVLRYHIVKTQDCTIEGDFFQPA